MDLHVVLVAVAALVGGGLVWLNATTAAGTGARRVVLGLAVILVALFYIATTDLLGRPRPAAIEMFTGRLTGTEVLAHHLRQGEAIFLWVRPEIGDDPLSYRLPWSERTARALHEASRQAEEQGGTIQFSVESDEGTEGGEPAVDWIPPAAPPPKPRS